MLYNMWRSILKIIGLTIALTIFSLAVFAAWFFIGEAPEKEINYGVTFSQFFARQMGLDWQKAYLAALDDLEVKKIRLIAYWPLLEPEPQKYYFNDLDWQIAEARKRGAEVILAMGRKLPRWPECHIPSWADQMSEKKQQERVLALLDEIIRRYRGEDSIKVWQIENEPFLKSFGECPPLDENFLKKEIITVQKADSCEKRRPIMLTASGELSSWSKPAKYADILGTTLYRTVWVDELSRHFKYPLTPVFYYKRARIVKWLTGIERMVIIELQAEPWGPKMPYETPLGEQYQTMNLEKFKEIIDYTEKTGFDEAYLWGVEWWYWLKEKHGNDGLWQEAQGLF